MQQRDDLKDMGGQQVDDNDMVLVEQMPIGRDDVSGIPGQEDILVQTGAGQTPLPIVFLTGSEDPKEFLLRARFTEKEIFGILEATADFNAVYYADMDLMGIIALKANASAGRDGLARREAVQVANGMMGGMMGSMTRTFGRMRRNYNNNSAGPQS